MFRIADAEIAEAIVWHLWQEHLPKNKHLRLTDGRQLRVSCTGTLNKNSGPDFLNAELAFGPGRPIRGDVEIHVRPADWHRHGHETDPRYNPVILHVVMWNDEDDPSILKQNGQYVPTLVLSDCLSDSFNRLRRRHEQHDPAVDNRTHPCERYFQQASDATVHTLLMDAGEARFLSKARTLETRMARVSSEQALYEGLMRAAGYSKNTESFHDLAQRVPVATIRDLVHTLPPSEWVPTVQTLLFGVAGLLPSQSERRDAGSVETDPYIAELEARWHGFSTALPVRPMTETAWHFFRLRPFNFPTVRLAGLSYLITTGLDTGLDAPFLHSIEDGARTSLRKKLRRLRAVLDQCLQHDTGDYWVSHSVFGSGSHTGRSLLIGADRRREMMINVILPFLFTATADRPQLQSLILKLYALHPKLPDNGITRTMQAMLFTHKPDRRRLIDTAQLQQGLMHIENKTCYRKDCGQCGLNGERLTVDS